MNPVFLVNEVVKRLERKTSEFWLTGFNNIESEEKPFDKYSKIIVKKWGYVPNDPLDINDDGTLNPIAMVRLLEVSDSSESEYDREAGIIIYIMTYSKDKNGVEDCINICERIVQDFVKTPVVGSCFKLLSYPSYKNYSDDSNYPNYLFEINMTFSLPKPQEELNLCLL